MQYLIFVVFLTTVLGNAQASDLSVQLSNQNRVEETNSHAGQNPDQSDVCQSMETREIWCPLECNGIAEGEPALMDEYEDEYNSGCGYHGSGDGFQYLEGDQVGELVFCGKSGWYQTMGAESRDTDWFILEIGPTGQVVWTLEAERETYGILLGPQECDIVSVLDQMIAYTCNGYETMTISGEPGDVIWIWVAPTEYSAPFGFDGFEYNYISSFSGLGSATVATDNISFGAIKSLYR